MARQAAKFVLKLYEKFTNILTLESINNWINKVDFQQKYIFA